MNRVKAVGVDTNAARRTSLRCLQRDQDKHSRTASVPPICRPYPGRRPLRPLDGPSRSTRRWKTPPPGRPKPCDAEGRRPTSSDRYSLRQSSGRNQGTLDIASEPPKRVLPGGGAASDSLYRRRPQALMEHLERFNRNARPDAARKNKSWARPKASPSWRAFRVVLQFPTLRPTLCGREPLARA